MNKSIKVLLLADDLLPGGVSRHIVDIANYSFSTDINIFVAAAQSRYTEKLDLQVPFTPLSLLKKDSFDKNISGIFPSMYRLSQLIRKENIDIIHSHKRYTHFLGKMLSKYYDIPHITSYHSMPIGKKIFSVFHFALL